MACACGHAGELLAAKRYGNDGSGAPLVPHVHEAAGLTERRKLAARRSRGPVNRSQSMELDHDFATLQHSTKDIPRRGRVLFCGKGLLQARAYARKITTASPLREPNSGRLLLPALNQRAVDPSRLLKKQLLHLLLGGAGLQPCDNCLEMSGALAPEVRVGPANELSSNL
jgi:hypothetical protein